MTPALGTDDLTSTSMKIHSEVPDVETVLDPTPATGCGPKSNSDTYNNFANVSVSKPDHEDSYEERKTYTTFVLRKVSKTIHVPPEESRVLYWDKPDSSIGTDSHHNHSRITGHKAVYHHGPPSVD